MGTVQKHRSNGTVQRQVTRREGEPFGGRINEMRAMELFRDKASEESRRTDLILGQLGERR